MFHEGDEFSATVRAGLIRIINEAVAARCSLSLSSGRRLYALAPYVLYENDCGSCRKTPDRNSSFNLSKLWTQDRPGRHRAKHDQARANDDAFKSLHGACYLCKNVFVT